jgi:hypothetical protein
MARCKGSARVPEATYNLHIIRRFELELELLTGKFKAADLPAAWNARFEQFFGIVPPTDKDGLLQDIHWSQGLLGISLVTRLAISSRHSSLTKPSRTSRASRKTSLAASSIRVQRIFERTDAARFGLRSGAGDQAADATAISLVGSTGAAGRRHLCDVNGRSGAEISEWPRKDLASH